jgi:RHS repeat-associated protein
LNKQKLKYNYRLQEVLLYCDYNPFGMPMPGRKSGSQPYRFSFQGQEKDDEIKGQGNSLNYEYRMHDPRIGRFFAVDPLAAKYPYNSPYAFSENRVIDGIELEGLEYVDVDNTGMSPESIQSSKNSDDTYNISLGGESFNNVPMVNHNGKDYFKIDQHMYYNSENGWSTSGTAEEKMTEWAYTDIQNLVSNSGQTNVVNWSTTGNCYSNVQKQVGYTNTTPSWDWEGVTLYNTSARNGTATINPNNIPIAEDEINRQLEAGYVVAIGVDHDAWYTPYADSKNKVYNRYGTDHFVLITGRTMINDQAYFTFWENAVNDKDHVIDVGNGGNLISPSNMQGTSPHWGNTIYRVTYIMQNR